MDADRRDDEFVVHFDVPGVDPDSIDLTVEPNVLTVSATRAWQWGDGTDVLASGRPQGAFSRQLFLGDSLDLEHVDASYDSGGLTVRIPVADEAKPRKVEVAAGGAAEAARGLLERGLSRNVRGRPRRAVLDRRLRGPCDGPSTQQQTRLQI